MGLSAHPFLCAKNKYIDKNIGYLQGDIVHITINKTLDILGDCWMGKEFENGGKCERKVLSPTSMLWAR